jgi:phosphoadenosine phosphosulfate reductase
MKTDQTTLSEIKITTKSPKYHRVKKKKFFQKDYEIKSKNFEGIIKEAEDLGIDSFIVGYSGGKDSGKVLHKLNKMGKLYGVLHLRTNTGVYSTEEFVIKQCKEMDVKLFIREPTPLAFAYVAYCLQFGFPGANMHSSIMKILKYNTMKKFIQEPQFNGKHPAIVGGVRKWESTRRLGSYNSPVTQESDLWFVNPLFYESTEKVYEYFIKNGLKKAPSYDTLGFSGECMCGSFAQRGEAQLLKEIDPKRFEFIEWITDGIKRFGTKEAKKYSKWGVSQDFDDIRNQQLLKTFFDEDEIKHIDKMSVNVCGAECGPGSMKGALDY